MTVRLGLLALLKPKPGKGHALAAFLQAGRELAVAEEGTVTWYAFKISDTTYARLPRGRAVPASPQQDRTRLTSFRPGHPRHRHHRRQMTWHS
jgi:hypothetical protein